MQISIGVPHQTVGNGAAVTIYPHPLAADVVIKDRTFTVRDEPAIVVEDYDTYGRFLFTELNAVEITNCVINVVGAVAPWDRNPEDWEAPGEDGVWRFKGQMVTRI